MLITAPGTGVCSSWHRMAFIIWRVRSEKTSSVCTSTTISHNPSTRDRIRRGWEIVDSKRHQTASICDCSSTADLARLRSPRSSVLPAAGRSDSILCFTTPDRRAHGTWVDRPTPSYMQCLSGSSLSLGARVGCDAVCAASAFLVVRVRLRRRARGHLWSVGLFLDHARPDGRFGVTSDADASPCRLSWPLAVRGAASGCRRMPPRGLGGRPPRHR